MKSVYENNRLIGTFPTREAAQEYVKERVKNLRKDGWKPEKINNRETRLTRKLFEVIHFWVPI